MHQKLGYLLSGGECKVQPLIPHFRGSVLICWVHRCGRPDFWGAVTSSLWHLYVLLSHLGSLLLAVRQVQSTNAIDLLEQRGGLWDIKAKEILVDSVAMEKDSRIPMDLDNEAVLLSVPCPVWRQTAKCMLLKRALSGSLTCLYLAIWVIIPGEWS